MSENDPLIGQQLGNIRIERLVGMGGMAAVYLGLDTHLQRPVAVKVIAERYRNEPTFANRFLREARAVAALQHPNIVHIYHAGKQGDISYFVMKYVQGTDLKQWLQAYLEKGSLPPQSEVLRIGRSVASALDYAHENGVIHRDVKPSNVLISEDGRVVLTDFGLALQVSDATMGEVFGSPHYISPEQARKSSFAVPQSDLYSLGIILYEMLTGRLPFEDSSPASLAVQQITHQPPSPRSFNPALSPAVEGVLLRALRKTPKERFQTGAALIRALEQALSGTNTVPVLVEAVPVPKTQPVRTSMEPPVRSVIHNRGPGPQPYFQDASPLPSAGSYAAGPSYDSPPPAFPPAGAGSYPAGWRRRRPSPYGRLLRWGSGCLVAVFLCGIAAAVVINQPTPLAGTIFDPRQTETASLPVEVPSETPEPTAQPSETATPTGTAAPSETPVPTETPTPTETHTPSPTPTITPTPQTLQFALIIARNQDDSLFVINQGPDALPLERLRLANGDNELLGEEWELETLQEGQCTAVWKEEGNPQPPEDIECELVGKRLERKDNKKFWDKNVEVYYDNVLLETCRQDDQICRFVFTVRP